MLEEAARATCDFYIATPALRMAFAIGIRARRTCTSWAIGRLYRPNPYNDYEPVDSSASAIAAQGLIRLGTSLGASGNTYLRAGLAIARQLLAEPYLSTRSKA